MKRTLSLTSALPAVLCLALVGCEASKSSNPLSPSVAGPIAGVQITAPKMLEPAQGFRFKENEQPIKLLIENSSSTGVRPVTYTFEVASDDAFSSKVYARSGVAAGDGGRTSVIVEKLDLGRGYYWRVRADDGANSSMYASSNFEVLPKALLNPPALLSPIDNVRTTTRRPELTVGSSERNAAVGRVTYEFQIATDPAFPSNSLVAAGGRDDAGDRTSYTPDGELTLNIQHFWRVRATDGETTSAWSSGQVFRTPVPIVVPPPTVPGPTNPGAPCNSSNPDTIVKCERAKYGFMSRDQMLELMKASARSLNRNAIPNGPWGILRKAAGNQCGGYSCDIVCAGQGTSQRQVDILGDVESAQVAGWGATHTYPGIRVDICEIQ